MTHTSWRLAAALVVAFATGAVLVGRGTQAQDQPAAEAPEPAPEFTPAFLNDPANAQAGRVIWEEQCASCHGRKAYPGKAPKLQPKRYKPDFVWDRVTNGFRGMPPWKDVYTPEERMQVVAWVMNRKFSP